MMLDRTTQPSLSDFEDLEFKFPKLRHLSNGIEIYVLNAGDQEVNKLDIIFRGGVFEQKIPNQAMMVTSMLIHGTENKSSSELSEFFDYYGTIINTRNVDNYTSVSALSLNDKMDKVLPVLHDLVYKPTFPEKEFVLLKEKLKGVAKNLNKRVRYLSQIKALQLLLGENHPTGHCLTEESVDALTREDLLAFHDMYYRPENCIIVASGKIDEELFNKIDSVFGVDEFTGEKVLFNHIEELPSDKHFDIVDKDDAMQSSVMMVHKSIFRNHPDFIKLRIVVNALGGYFGSRLVKNIREDKGYTYGIGASLCATANDSYVVINSECDTKYTSALIEEVKKEVEIIRTTLMDDDELKTLKNCMMSDLVKSLDTPISMSSLITSTIYYSTNEEYFNNQWAIIKRITAEDIRDIAYKYLHLEGFYTVVAGNKKVMALESV